jgi:tetratricopeptide (TPR) repeat protein
MAAALAAMQAQDYALALQNYRDALRAVPNDAEAARGVRQAQARMDRRVNRREEFDRQMRKAADAYRRRQYADAVRAYDRALDFDPDNRQALAGRRQARYALNMVEGQDAMNARRYGEAADKFREALELVPNDPQARIALQRAQALDRTNKRP